MNTTLTHPDQTLFIPQLAKEYGLSQSAVETLYLALQRGGGGMAQFSHPELGGCGQWMRNGMIMIGDMFNHSLKAKVDAVCRALLPHLNDPSTSSAATTAVHSARESSSWWPSEYTSPAATGGQNNFRYAYFPQSEALVVEQNGETTVYDTKGHDFHGFGQQQSSSSGFSIQSSAGVIDLAKLPRKKTAPVSK